MRKNRYYVNLNDGKNDFKSYIVGRKDYVLIKGLCKLGEESFNRKKVGLSNGENK